MTDRNTCRWGERDTEKEKERERGKREIGRESIISIQYSETDEHYKDLDHITSTPKEKSQKKRNYKDETREKKKKSERAKHTVLDNTIHMPRSSTRVCSSTLSIGGRT
jgi:hypothetical protein